MDENVTCRSVEFDEDAHQILACDGTGMETSLLYLRNGGIREKSLRRDESVGGIRSTNDDGDDQWGDVSSVNKRDYFSSASRSCLQKVNGASKYRDSHDSKRRHRIECNLALMNVACGGSAACVRTPAKVSPRLLALHLTYRDNVSARVALARLRALVNDSEFKACFGEDMSVLGRGEKGERKLHAHLAVSLQHTTNHSVVEELVRKMAQQHGFGPHFEVEPVRSVEDYGIAIHLLSYSRALPKSQKTTIGVVRPPLPVLLRRSARSPICRQIQGMPLFSTPPLALVTILCG